MVVCILRNLLYEYTFTFNVSYFFLVVSKTLRYFLKPQDRALDTHTHTPSSSSSSSSSGIIPKAKKKILLESTKMYSSEL